MVVAAAIFSIWMVVAHSGDAAAFARSSACILVMLTPVAVYLVAGKLTATKKTSHFGGSIKTFVTTAVCTAAVIIVNVIAGLQWPSPGQALPWEIYGFYLAISVGEEVYYRLVLCWGILALMSSKNRVLGAIEAALVSALGFIGGFQASVELRMAWILVSILAFAVFYIAAGRAERNVPKWAIVVAVAVSSVSFSMAHWNVYQKEPEMLWAMGIGALIMASFLLATRNPFVPFVAHFGNNLMALQGIVIN